MQVIYALVDPRDQKVWYVGVTDNIEVRYINHLRCREDNPVKNEWVDSLKAQGFLPVMQTLEVLHSRSKALERERYWIHHFNHLHMPLTNIAGPAIANSPSGLSSFKPLTPEDHVRELIIEGASQNEITAQVFSGKRNADAIQAFRGILASLMPENNVEDPQLDLVREMVARRKSQNEIIARVFPGMRNAEAIEEFRKYLAALVNA